MFRSQSARLSKPCSRVNERRVVRRPRRNFPLAQLGGRHAFRSRGCSADAATHHIAGLITFEESLRPVSCTLQLGRDVVPDSIRASFHRFLESARSRLKKVRNLSLRGGLSLSRGLGCRPLLANATLPTLHDEVNWQLSSFRREYSCRSGCVSCAVRWLRKLLRHWRK